MIFLIFLMSFTACAAGAEVSPAAVQLQTLVSMSSGTADVKGVGNVQAWLAKELQKLGFEVESGADGLLVGLRRGPNPKTITFLVHADTVFEKTTKSNSFTVSADGLTATGPGVIDDKGGIIVALEGLKLFLANHRNDFNFRFVSSPSEETGSPGLGERLSKIAQDTWLLLGFEPALDDGSIITQRRGNRWYKIKTTGREAHAGRAHKDGRNACVELSRKLMKISALTDYKRDVTVSVGHMRGGQDKYNIVCGEAEAKVDTRFASVEERDRLDRKLVAALNSAGAAGLTTKFEIVDDSAPFSAGKDSRPFVDDYLKAIATAEGRKVSAGLSGGAGDANSFSRPGLIILDGLGASGGKMHTEDEFITLSSLETRARALEQFLIRLHRPAGVSN